MFFHMVLFEIGPGEAAKYRKDCKMWAAYAKRHKGFLSYFTFKRYGHKNQYASVYQWKAKIDHGRFMKKLHDWLVRQSRAKVRVLGYYNFNVLDRVGRT